MTLGTRIMNEAFIKENRLIFLISLVYIFIYIFLLSPIVYVLSLYIKKLNLDLNLLKNLQINLINLEGMKDIISKLSLSYKAYNFFSFPDSLINCKSAFCSEILYLTRHIINTLFLLFFVKHLLNRDFFTYFGLNKCLWGESLKKIWLAVLTYLIFFYSINIFNNQPDIWQQVGVSITNPYVWIRSLILMPIIEEIIFRGFLYQLIKDTLLKTTLTSRYAAFSAGFLQSMFWGLTHLQYSGVLAYVSIISLGCLLAYIREKTRSIYPCMIYHGFLNALTNILNMMLK